MIFCVSPPPFLRFRAYSFSRCFVCFKILQSRLLLLRHFSLGHACAIELLRLVCLSNFAIQTCLRYRGIFKFLGAHRFKYYTRARVVSLHHFAFLGRLRDRAGGKFFSAHHFKIVRALLLRLNRSTFGAACAIGTSPNSLAHSAPPAPPKPYRGFRSF